MLCSQHRLQGIVPPSSCTLQQVEKWNLSGAKREGESAQFGSILIKKVLTRSHVSCVSKSLHITSWPTRWGTAFSWGIFICRSNPRTLWCWLEVLRSIGHWFKSADLHSKWLDQPSSNKSVSESADPEGQNQGSGSGPKIQLGAALMLR